MCVQHQHVRREHESDAEAVRAAVPSHHVARLRCIGAAFEGQRAEEVWRERAESRSRGRRALHELKQHAELEREHRL